MTLHEKIYQCRRRAGLSQEALAEKLGVSRQAVSKWETGESAPEIGKLLLLARTFQVSTDWLLSEEDFPADAPDDGSTADDAPPPRDQTAAPADDPARDASPHSSAAWVDAIPGAVGRLLRRYGWLAGVYMALIGAAFSAMGLMIKAMFGQFTRAVNGMTGGFPGSFPSGTTVLIDGTRVTSGSSSMMTAPGEMMGNFVLGVGLVLLVGGVVLAIVLKRQSRK